MKYINKKKVIYKKKQNKFYLKKNIFFLSLIFIFFLGIWTERFDLKIHIKNFTNDVINTAANRFFLTFGKKNEKIVIDINYKNYQKILSTREKSIKALRATEDIHEWVSAKMNMQDKDYKIKIKLKGVHSEHWEHSKKWSFKIKLLDDKSIDGVKRFSIQRPRTRDYLYEWLFMEVLKKEKLIYHRTKYPEIIINGENLGVYFFEEQHSKQLIENNKRREGPIIGLDKNLWIKEINNLNDLTVNVLEDSFLRAAIKPVQFDNDKTGSEQEIYLKNAINLFEDFRKNKIEINQAFDLKQLATLMAIKVIFGSQEFDWRDIKFYYNPITSLLEPIGREVHINKNFVNANPWWISSDGSEWFVHSRDQRKFINLLFNNNEFYEMYLSELFRLTDDNYLNNVINQNKENFLIKKKLLQSNFPLEKVFSIEHLYEIRKMIRKTLDPVQGINVYFLNYEKDNILLSIQNTQRLPILIDSLKINDNEILTLKKPIIIKGRKNNTSLENYLINIPCNNQQNNQLCSDYIDNKNSIIENSVINYKILGQNSKKQSKIFRFYASESIQSKNKILLDVNDLQKLNFINVDEDKKEINFNQDKIIIKERLIIPSGYTVNFKQGTEITFEEEGQIISYSHLIMEGKKNNPIKFTTNSEKPLANNKFGNGISIINAKSKSVIKNTIFLRLTSPNVKSGEGLLGAINIYKSDIVFENCKFIENLGEDFLNIISSNFLIKNVLMNKINYDAVDFDFSVGIIDGISIINSGNDALDFSGSEVVAKNVSINQVGDKGISAGESSEIRIENIKINNANIAVASKDLSKLNIKNIDIKNSKIAAAAYQKKSEYGPGFLNIEQIKIANTLNTYLSEKRSIIKVNDETIKSTDLNYAAF